MNGSKAARKNLIAGTFLLVSLALAVAITVTLSDLGEHLVRTQRYAARFDLKVGTGGLAPGSPVMVGGQRAGRVVGLAIEPGEGGVPASVLVRFRLRADLRVHEDAEIRLEAPLLGTGAQLNIVNPGTPEAPLLEPGGVLTGVIAPPSFLAQAGFGPEQAEQIRQLIADLSDISQRTRGLLADLEPWMTDQERGLVGVIGDAKQITGDLRARLPGWSDRVDSILTSAEGTAQDVGALVDELRSGVREARDGLAEVRAVVGDNREEIDRIIASLDRALDAIDRESIGRLNEALTRVAQTAQRADDAMGRLMDWFEREVPGLRRTLANARLASDQLKLTAIEVRRAPWRLLYQPGRKELEEEVLWSAARAYAEAVSDLRVVSEALAAVSADHAPGDPTPEAIRSELQSAFEKYRQAEREFLERLTQYPQ